MRGFQEAPKRPPVTFICYIHIIMIMIIFLLIIIISIIIAGCPRGARPPGGSLIRPRRQSARLSRFLKERNGDTGRMGW